MPTRRQLLKVLTYLFFWVGASIGLGISGATKLWAGVKKRILPKDTDLTTLRNENPEFLDTRNLQVMPLDAFQTMGDKDLAITTDTWRLEVAGEVQTKLALTYDEVLALSPLEREVLLVCPGVFVNHGKWKGFALKALMQRAGSSPDVSKVHFYGRSRYGERKETFSIADVTSDRVFLAYAVNDHPLPRIHGYPLRVVAEGHWGMHWVKYVFKVEFI